MLPNSYSSGGMTGAAGKPGESIAYFPSASTSCTKI